MHPIFRPSIRSAYWLAASFVLLLAIHAIGPRAAHAAIPAGLPDTTPPTVLATDPVNAATGVTVAKILAVTFSEAMDPATITSATFTLQQAGTPVLGTVIATGATATFQPAAPLAVNATFVAVISTGAKDLAGNPLANDFVWFFSTTPDSTPPTVVSTSPAEAETGVPINRKIFVTFSEPMDAATLTTATFTLRQGATPIRGTVASAGNAASFTPANLTPGLVYTGLLTVGARDVAGNALVSSRVWTFTTASGPDLVPPTVQATVPAAGAVGVPLDQAISVTFDEEMDPLSLNGATFLLAHGATPVAGIVTATSRTAVFHPVLSLAPATAYTATISPAVKDAAGNALATSFTLTFTTTADVTAPAVASTVPANLAVGVATDQAISATFVEPMNPATLTTATFTLRQGATPVRGTVTFSGVTATFVPVAALAINTTYTATIAAGVRDLAGNPLASDFVWSFVTGAPDTTAPTVVATDPTDGATAVPIDKKITATFSEAMNPATITSATFTLRRGGTPVLGTVTYAGVTATFAPLVTLAPDTNYSAAISVGAKDVAGNPLASARAWSFTSGNQPPNTGQAVVVTFRNCDLTADSAFNLTVTRAKPYATIKIMPALVSGAHAAPSNVPRQGGTIVLLNCARIPSVTVQGGMASFYTQVPVGELTVSGELGRVSTARSSVEVIRASTVDSVIMFGTADSFGVSGTSNTYTATTIYSRGSRHDGMKIDLTGVVLEDLVTSQSLDSVSVASRRVPVARTGGVKGVISVGGIGRVIPAGASGSVATEFRLQAQGVTKVKASGASILPDQLDSTRNNILQLTAQSQSLAGHTIGGLVGDTGGALHVQAANIGFIRGDKGVHGEFIAGTSTSNHTGLILLIATQSVSSATTRTTPISGDAYVGQNNIIFIPDRGTMTVHTSNNTSRSLSLAPDPAPAAIGLGKE